MDIKIDPEVVQGLVEQAILNQIDADARERIMAAAVKALLDPRTSPYDRYGPKTTALQDAFTQAVDTAARTIVREQVENDPQVRQAILDLISGPIAEIARGNYDGLPEKIGAAVAAWLRDRSSD